MAEDLGLAEVFERYAGTVYRLAFSRTKSRADADDLLQEVFLRYTRAAPEFAEEEHRKAWLIRVTLRCCASLMSSVWMRRTVPLEQAALVPADLETDHSDVYQAVMQLPAKYRTAVHLYYYEGYTIPQIATLCGMAEATVKTHLRRARERLRKKLTLLEGEGNEQQF
ncbi:MAG: sigma-70 family RNA polymerase sigma factor [Clostridia bacterium]|nr:sigma-70 family RNA polymerase sigma factor [Clostridia bacterium]